MAASLSEEESYESADLCLTHTNDLDRQTETVSSSPRDNSFHDKQPSSTDPVIPPCDIVNASSESDDLKQKVVEVNSTSEQQLQCQPGLQANIEAVVEMLLENSKHLPGFTQIIEQATRHSQGLPSQREVGDKHQAAEPVSVEPTSTDDQQCDIDSSKQLDSLRTSSYQTTETDEQPGPSSVQDNDTQGSSDTASNDVQRILASLLSTEPERQKGNSTSKLTTTRKGKRNKNSEESDQSLTKRHKCPECDKLFPRASSLKRHILLHMDDRPFQCKECDANYKSYSQLQRHLRIHTGEKPAKCEQCSKTFRTYNELYVHRRTHTGEKPFECKFCGKCFSTRGYRNTHERIHTGEKRFECDICGMKFTESSARRVHRFTHTGENPYKCRVCGRGFTQAGNLSKHIKTIHSTNKPFKCDECEKAFAVKQELTRHYSRVHSNDKPHACKQCGKKYAIYSDLTQHKNTHKNRCSNCGTKFKDSHELERHIMEDCLIPGYISPAADSDENDGDNDSANDSTQIIEPASSSQQSTGRKRRRAFIDDTELKQSSHKKSKGERSSKRSHGPSETTSSSGTGKQQLEQDDSGSQKSVSEIMEKQNSREQEQQTSNEITTNCAEVTQDTQNQSLNSNKEDTWLDTDQSTGNWASETVAEKDTVV